MKESRRILIIDDERPILLTLEALLKPPRISDRNRRHGPRRIESVEK